MEIVATIVLCISVRHPALFKKNVCISFILSNKPQKYPDKLSQYFRSSNIRATRDLSIVYEKCIVLEDIVAGNYYPTPVPIRITYDTRLEKLKGTYLLR